MMTFVLTDEQQAAFLKWKIKLEHKKRGYSTAAIGGAYTFRFTPTSIGTFISVKGYGKKLVLSDCTKF